MAFIPIPWVYCCSSFCSCLRWNLWSLISDLSAFSDMFGVKKFPFKYNFITSYKFVYVLFLVLFTSQYFLIPLYFFFLPMHSLELCYLFPNICPPKDHSFISDLILLQSEIYFVLLKWFSVYWELFNGPQYGLSWHLFQVYFRWKECVFTVVEWSILKFLMRLIWVFMVFNSLHCYWFKQFDYDVFWNSFLHV